MFQLETAISHSNTHKLSIELPVMVVRRPRSWLRAVLQRVRAVGLANRVQEFAGRIRCLCWGQKEEQAISDGPRREVDFNSSKPHVNRQHRVTRNRPIEPDREPKPRTLLHHLPIRTPTTANMSFVTRRALSTLIPPKVCCIMKPVARAASRLNWTNCVSVQVASPKVRLFY